MQRLYIRNFGPIKEIDLPIKDLTILVGPNGSGKTLLAKLAFFFNLLPGWIYEKLNDLVYDSPTTESPHGLQIEVISNLLQKDIPNWFRSYLGSKEFLTPQTYFEFVWDSGVTMRLVVNDPLYLVQVDESVALKDALEEIWEHVTSQPGDLPEKGISKQKVLQHKLFTLFNNSSQRQFARYLPETRAAYWNLMSKYLRDSTEKDLLNEMGVDRGEDKMQLFLTRYLIQRRQAAFLYEKSFDDRQLRLQQDVALGIKAPQKVEALIKLDQEFQHLAGGKLAVDSYGNEELVLDSGHRLAMEQASSGQRVVSGFFPVLYHDLWFGLSSFYAIEEPESHLYPQLQKSLVDLLAFFLNASGPEARMVLTTHSPYVLTAIDNLITAAEVAREKPDQADQVREVVPEKFWVDYERVSAVFLEEGKLVTGDEESGEEGTILDHERRSLSESKLDHAGNEMEEAYARLLQIRYSLQKA